MRKFLAGAAFLSLIGLAGSASASVTYTFDSGFGELSPLNLQEFIFFPFGQHFEFTTADFITKYTKLDGQAANCVSFFESCNSVEFSPQAKSDVITINTSSGGFPFFSSFESFESFDNSSSYAFQRGAFGADGTYTSEDFATLTVSVSSVPLPASAPMFGAALLALAAAGYGLKRKTSVTV